MCAAQFLCCAPNGPVAEQDVIAAPGVQSAQEEFLSKPTPSRADSKAVSIAQSFCCDHASSEQPLLEGAAGGRHAANLLPSSASSMCAAAALTCVRHSIALVAGEIPSHDFQPWRPRNLKVAPPSSHWLGACSVALAGSSVGGGVLGGGPVAPAGQESALAFSAAGKGAHAPYITLAGRPASMSARQHASTRAVQPRNRQLGTNCHARAHQMPPIRLHNLSLRLNRGLGATMGTQRALQPPQ